MSLPTLVGVYGGGRMGAGIAHALLVAGTTVVVVESDDQTAAAARERIDGSLQKAEQRGALSSSAAALANRCTVTTSPGDLQPCGLVIEAVPEDIAVKREVLSRVERLVPAADLATNTSSLSIDSIASGLNRPEALIGLHFFNPVPASQLVEIVRGTATSAELTEQAMEWVRALGKTGITVRDSPGFASSRLGVALAVEAIRMLEEGVASAQDIDTAMQLGYKHPAGPLKTTDIVGLDVRLAIAQHLADELGNRFAPPALLSEKVASGELGRKAGKGFYDW